MTSKKNLVSRKRKKWQDLHAQRNKSETERFWEKTERRPNGCIEWVACKDKDGYGFFRVNGKNKKAHRYVFAILWGKEPPSSAHVCHRCDNPPCVNPDHLFLGNNHINQQDSVIKGRAASTRLSVDDVREIRRLVNGGQSQSAVARNYGVHPSHVCKIMSGAKWSYVD